MELFMRKENHALSGYLTVYLSLIMTIILSLCLVLIEGARSAAINFEAESVSDIGLNSVMAEYHRELLDKYNIFAIDSSYLTDYASKSNTERHLKEYIDRNLSMDNVFLSSYMYRDFLSMKLDSAVITNIEVLTDNEGGVFRECAINAVKDDFGAGLYDEVKKWLDDIEEYGIEETDLMEKKKELDNEIEREVDKAQEDDEEEIIREDGTIEIVEIEYEPYESPTKLLDEQNKQGILKYVVDDAEKLSNNSIWEEGLIKSRMNNFAVTKGNWTAKGSSDENENFMDRFLFQEYLMAYMGHYGKEKEDGALQYQLEYLICEKAHDADNLKGVANRLCLIREGANAIYLFSDEQKCLEAEALALIIAAIVRAPDIVKPLKASILLGWAYAESVYDVKVILSGGKIPLIKDEGSWHYSLQNALGQNLDEGIKENNGLGYEDYLRVFMCLTDINTLTARAMNIVEADIRKKPYNSAFRMDACFSSIEADLELESSFGYTHKVTCKRSYR